MGKPDRLYPDIDRLQEYLSRGGRSKARQDGYVYAKEYPIVLGENVFVCRHVC